MNAEQIAVEKERACQARAWGVLHLENGDRRPTAQRLDIIEYSENSDPETYGGGALRIAVKHLFERLQRERRQP